MTMNKNIWLQQLGDVVDICEKKVMDWTLPRLRVSFVKFAF